MKFFTDKRDFLRVLNTVSHPAFAKTIIPSLNKCFITATQSVSISTTDLSTYIVSKLQSTVHKPGYAIVDAKSLFEFVSKASNGFIYVETNGKEVTFSQNKASLILENGVEFPATPSVDGGVVYEQSPELLFETLKRVHTSMADISKGSTSGVHFYVTKDRIMVSATDSARLTSVKHALRLKVSNLFQKPNVIPDNGVKFVIQRNSVLELIRLLKNAKILVTSVDKDFVKFTIDTFTSVVAVKQDGIFPDPIQALEHEKWGRTEPIFLEKKNVMQAVSSILEQKASSVFLQFSKNKLNVSVNTGTSSLSWAVQVEGDVDMDLFVNLKFLKDALAALSDRISVKVVSPTFPILLTDDNGCSVVIMPIVNA